MRHGKQGGLQGGGAGGLSEKGVWWKLGQQNTRPTCGRKELEWSKTSREVGRPLWAKARPARAGTCLHGGQGDLGL